MHNMKKSCEKDLSVADSIIEGKYMILFRHFSFVKFLNGVLKNVDYEYKIKNREEYSEEW